MRPDGPESPEPSRSIEDRILLCGAHPHLSRERRERLTRLVSSSLDWPGLLEQADRHGMVPLLSHHLRGMPDAGIPEAALAALAHRSRECLVWNLRLQRELIRLLGAFNQAAVPVMPLKGPLLADLLYGDLALRPMTDIDLLVRPEDLAKGEQILLGAGCSRLLPAEQEGDNYHNLYAAECGDGASILVELHRDLAPSFMAQLDGPDIWASASRVAWEGREIWTMALPDLFLYLCLHAVKDGLGSLRALLDIALAVERFGGVLPWEELARRVRAARIRTPVTLSLLESRGLLGAPVPPEFLEAIRPWRGLSWRLGQALFRWRGGVLHTPPALLGTPATFPLLFLWEDSLRGKLRLLRRNLFPSASLRARWTSLPPSSSVLRWYPVWIWHACRHLTRQHAPGLKAGQAAPRQV